MLLSALALIHLSHMVKIEACRDETAVHACRLFFPFRPPSSSNLRRTRSSVPSPAHCRRSSDGLAQRSPVGDSPYFRWKLLVEPGAIYLFALLFLWQLPHFLAINWMYRDQYRQGGFVMLANEDEEGSRTSFHALGYSIATLLLMFYPVYEGVAHSWFLIGALPLAGWLCWLAWKFRVHRERPHARKLFFCTLAIRN